MSKEHVDSVYWAGVVVFILTYILGISLGNQAPIHPSLELYEVNVRRTLLDQPCERNFKGHLHKCMAPFTRKVDLYTTSTSQNPFVYRIFVKHVCRQYKKMLHCIHTVLTHCHTPNSTLTVQHQLRHDWVLTVNQMCHIQLNPPIQTADQQALLKWNSSVSEGKIIGVSPGTRASLPQTSEGERPPGLPRDLTSQSKSHDSLTVISFNKDTRTKGDNWMAVTAMSVNNLSRLLNSAGRKPYLVQLFYSNTPDTNTNNSHHSSVDAYSFLNTNNSASTNSVKSKWIVYAFSILHILLYFLALMHCK